MINREKERGVIYIAKKVKKITKKATDTKPAKKHHHHWHPHDFMIVFGGGFIIIVLLLFVSGSFGLNLFPNRAQSNASEVMEEVGIPEKTITIEAFSYTPDPVTVKVGTTVTWVNNDADPHSATADNGVFNTDILEQGESGSVTFSTPGEYTYHCSIHPNMTGTIIVEE